MQPLRVVALVASLSLTGQVSSTLRVMRTAPESPADPRAEITVTFDRPVAGGLDASVDPRTVFRIQPDIDGTLEWRDPMTLRFTPAEPLTPEASYAITIAAGLRGMDGSTLERPFTYTFRVAPPTVLGGDPANTNQSARFLPPNPTFSVLVSTPLDRSILEQHTNIVVSQVCGGSRVGVRVTDQRRIREDDPRWFEWLGYQGPWPRDTARDLRRVVDLTPTSPLPLDCAAMLRIPYHVATRPDSMLSWPIRTYGPLRLTAVHCGTAAGCPTGPLIAEFSTPVRGAEVLRHVRVVPGVTFTISDTADISPSWRLEATLAPRQHYAVTVASGLTDIFGQSFEGPSTRATQTTGYTPSLSHEYGRLLVERDGLRTLPVQHVNVDTLLVTTVAVPDSMVPEFLTRNWNWDEPWADLVAGATRTRVAVSAARDERRVTGVRLPLSTAASAGGATLHAVQISSPSLDSLSRRRRPTALVQVTDLAVHARIGADQGMVWVTGVSDGLPRRGASVTYYDALGRVRVSGTTDATGLARLDNYAHHAADPCASGWCALEGYVAATLNGDRSLVGITSYDPDLAPWRFGINAAWEQQRLPESAALFTERGIYRPGEPVMAKAIVRDGPLGSLSVPQRDSVRWVFRDREGGEARDTVVRLSGFGSSDQRFALPPDAPLGWYNVELQRMRHGEWRTVAYAGYQVAEYRPPEFLVDVNTDPAPRLAGDTLTATVSGRYLFGAPMARAPVHWTVLERPLYPWEFSLPGHEDWRIGVQGNWWEEYADEPQQQRSGIDTLDASGQRDLRVPLTAPAGGRGATLTVQAVVTDANRQVVTAGASVRVLPASFSIAARVAGSQWFWRAGDPVEIDVAAVRPDGSRLADIDVAGTVVRREWHRVRRVRNGQVDEVGNWVSDTVATCALRTTLEPASCRFTPDRGGSYSVTFRARDEQRREAVTSFPRWASGPGWVPWSDDTQLKMDVIADRERYAPGDTAILLFASPFTDAEAWITVERERVFESRRLRITDGATTLRLPITEAHAPNVFVSIVVVKGRSAAPGPLDDPGRPTLRVGYTQLRVTPEVKRLAVKVEPLPVRVQSSGAAAPGDGSSRSPSPSPTEYQPGDSARFAIRVSDANGRGHRAEVTLWAVDVGVLALTGYRTPDPLDLLYSPRGVGIRLASNLVRVAPQIPDGEKGKREAGGGGGGEETGILRSRFQTTAFFLGSIVTNERGEAEAVAKLPDNLTTFRVMAVAITAGDRFGSGDAEILVTRPLVARPALPRFLRPGDRFAAGVVVNQRLGGTPTVEVRAEADNVRVEGRRRQEERLAEGRGREFRFDILGRRERSGPIDPLLPDSAWFRFDAKSRDEADAVRLGIPYRAAWHPLTATVAGVLRDTASVEIALVDDVDAASSQLMLTVGTSPLGFINGARVNLRFYPYYCTEQVASVALPAIALLQAGREVSTIDTARAARTARDAVRTILRRQTAEGGIGYWSALDWTSPWLSSWAGRVLLEARQAGIEVDSAAISRIADYVQRHLSGDEMSRVPIAWWYVNQSARLAERVAAVDFLSRVGRPDRAAENVLLANAVRLRWEDRVLLAEILARRGDAASASTLLNAVWQGVRVDGRTAVLPPQAYDSHYFLSRVRPAARLLSATLNVMPTHAQLGTLVETLVQQGRVAETSPWNTQDWGWAVLALADYHRARADAMSADVRVQSGRRTLLAANVRGNEVRDTVVALDGLIRGSGDARHVRIDLTASPNVPLYWFASVREVPASLQTRQVDRGIRIERWYERVDDGKPTVSVTEGDLVRVKLRVTVPAERRFVVVDDPLPAGLEAVDLSLRTLGGLSAFVAQDPYAFQEAQWEAGWYYGSWDAGFWSPFDHKELRDDRVLYSATVLWPGSYTATYLARATTPGTFIAPPVHAEEMYNRGVNGRTAATRFVVEPGPR